MSAVSFSSNRSLSAPVGKKAVLFCIGARQSVTRARATEIVVYITLKLTDTLQLTVLALTVQFYILLGV